MREATGRSAAFEVGHPHIRRAEAPIPVVGDPGQHIDPVIGAQPAVLRERGIVGDQHPGAVGVDVGSRSPLEDRQVEMLFARLGRLQPDALVPVRLPADARVVGLVHRDEDAPADTHPADVRVQRKMLAPGWSGSGASGGAMPMLQSAAGTSKRATWLTKESDGSRTGARGGRGQAAGRVVLPR